MSTLVPSIFLAFPSTIMINLLLRLRDPAHFANIFGSEVTSCNAFYSDSSRRGNRCRLLRSVSSAGFSSRRTDGYRPASSDNTMVPISGIASSSNAIGNVLVFNGRKWTIPSLMLKAVIFLRPQREELDRHVTRSEWSTHPLGCLLLSRGHHSISILPLKEKSTTKTP